MKEKTVFFCTECGNESPKWSGQCRACGAWNTMVEQPAASKAKASRSVSSVNSRKPKLLSELETDAEMRFSTGLGEFDRVLGGGAVCGSLVLVGGAPGIGKSTLLLQICRYICKKQKVLYITGEESEHQVKLRADRLKVHTDGLYILSETDIAEISNAVNEMSPDVLIIDSIQTLQNREVSSSPGSVTQVKDCTATLMEIAKGQGVTVFVVGHINKDGAIAGPKVLEHMVDCVLYFEGERSLNYRVLRAAKNRFGSTNEIGIFEMETEGLTEVMNPSEMLISGRPKNAPGTCVTCILEGTRPLLAEVQALVTPSSFNVPRRNSTGADYNRAMMLLAVLEKRGGMRVGGCDAYLNVIGGMELDDTSSDLAVILACASSYRDKVIGDDTVVIGEVGLTGELRPVSNIDHRINEIVRLGFKRCILPASCRTKTKHDIELCYVSSISEAMKFLS